MQARGRAVALVDRLGAVARETSFGNAGIVQSEAVFPYVFPRAPAEIAGAALNLDPRVQIRYARAASIAPWVVALFPRLLAGSRRRPRGDGDARAGPRCVAEHRALAEAAGAGALLREGGWIKVFRTSRGEDLALADVEETEALRHRQRDADRDASSRSSRISARSPRAACILPIR